MIKRYKIRYDSEGVDMSEDIYVRKEDTFITAVDKNGGIIRLNGSKDRIEAIGSIVSGGKLSDFVVEECECNMNELPDRVILGIGLRYYSVCERCNKSFSCNGYTKWSDEWREDKCEGWEDDMSWTR